VPAEDYVQLATGDSAKLYVYEHIRENAHDLYGFISLDTKALFEQLLSVNGVGPKVALSILGIGTSLSLRRAIAEGNIKYIQAAPGVGKRVAERVVVELKDKVGLVSIVSSESTLFTATSIAQTDEAVQALTALGYTIQDAVQALAGIDESLTTEVRVKQALRGAQ